MRYEFLAFIIFILLVAVIALVAALSQSKERKRREELSALAARLGLQFFPEKNYEITSRFPFLSDIHRSLFGLSVAGYIHYACNVLSGSYEQQEVTAFEFYHYDGRHYLYLCSFLTLTLPQTFPDLRITIGEVSSQVARNLGHGDIEFESHEFSSIFHVRSRDKKFAYDICNPQMMEYLLAHRTPDVAIYGNALTLEFKKQLLPREIEICLNRLVQIRARIPNYVLEGV